MIKKTAWPCLLLETSICTLSLIMRETSAKMSTSSVGWLTMSMKIMAWRQFNIISVVKHMEKAFMMRKEVSFPINFRSLPANYKTYNPFRKLLLVLGGDKTDASSASTHGKTIDTAYDLYLYLKQHHSTVTHTYHEASHQVDKREYHYFLRGTFLSYVYHPCIPKKLSAVKPFYTFAVKRSEHPQKYCTKESTTVCPNCLTGNFLACFNVGWAVECGRDGY